MQSVTLRECNALELEPFRKQGWIVTNPPYGERIGGGEAEAGANLEGFMERASGFYDHTGWGQFQKSATQKSDHRRNIPPPYQLTMIDRQ